MSKKCFMAAVLGTSALIAAATPAMAEPLKITSENVVFYGDVSEQKGKEIVEEMELYRKTIFAIADQKNPRADKKKLTVYGAYDAGDVQDFAGMGGIAGVYTANTYDGPVFITMTRKGYKDGDFSREVALHEYSHHVLHGIVTEDFPRWYDEGFANYLSSFKYEDGVIKIGLPSAEHANGLKRGRFPWIDVRDVLTAISEYPFSDKRGRKRAIGLNQFYAQSWLYVHYMQSNTKFSGKLPGYLKQINSGAEPIAAFESAFGMDVDSFHKEAKNYWTKNDFKVFGFRPDADFLSVPMTVEKLDDETLGFHIAHGQRNFLSKKTAKDVSKRLNAYENKYGQTTESMAIRASVSITLKDYDDAMAYANAAYASAPGETEGLRTLGDVYFHKSHADKFKDAKPTDLIKFELNDDMKKAIDYFEKTIRQDQEDYTANAHLVSFYGNTDADVTTTGIFAANLIYDEYFESGNTGTGLDLANIYMRSGDATKACALFKTAKAQAESSATKDKNNMVKRVEAFEAQYSGSCS